MAEKGLRVIGVASSQFTMTGLPGEQHDFMFEFLGLIGLADPVRPTVAQALKECYTAGIRVIMITGYVTLENALACMRNRAETCVFKPLNDLGELEEAVASALKHLNRWQQKLSELQGMKPAESEV